MEKKSPKRWSKATQSGAKPFHGYYFKVLKGQGPAAPLGQMDFVVKGAMIGGFALAAAPAQYRVTGVQTFIVGPNGVVYQKDLGADTLKAFQSMDRYNPDKTWEVTEDDVEGGLTSLRFLKSEEQKQPDNLPLSLAGGIESSPSHALSRW